MTTLLRPRCDAAGPVELRQVDAALRASRARPLLSAVLPEESGAACYVLDAKYRPGASCLVLYRLGDRLVRGELRFDERDGERTAEDGAPQMRLWPYPEDPALPGLSRALTPGALEAALERALAAVAGGRPRVLRTRVTLLRYRPGKRATLLIDVRLRTPSGARPAATYIGKVYHDAAKAAAVHQETSLLARAPSVRSGRVALATPVAYLPDLAMTLQTPVTGAPLDLLLARATSTGVTARARKGVLRAADALAALHAAPLASARRRPVAVELRKLARRASRVAVVDPETGACLVALIEALVESVPERAEERLVHGDCKPSQFLVARDGVALLDFDHCGVADPACDVGTFLATLRQTHIRQACAAGRGRDDQWRDGRGCDGGLPALEEDFLSAYLAASRAGDDLVARARWQEAVALTRKAMRAYARAPRSPLPPLLTEAARACLAAGAETGRPRKQGPRRQGLSG